jgi:hypothetical protein
MTGRSISVSIFMAGLTSDISGFYFMAADDDFKPDDDLTAFLEKGDPPVYIGLVSLPQTKTY